MFQKHFDKEYFWKSHNRGLKVLQQNKLKLETLFLHKFKSRNRGLKVVQQNKLKCETLFLAIFRISILESGLKEGKEAQQKS